MMAANARTPRSKDRQPVVRCVNRGTSNSEISEGPGIPAPGKQLLREMAGATRLDPASLRRGATNA